MLTRLGDRLRRGSSATVLDQVVSSASNFLVLALVARAAGPAQYALFAGALGVWFFVLGVQRALVVEPMILSAQRHPGEVVAGRRRGLRVAACSAPVLAAATAVVAVVRPQGAVLAVGLALAVVVPGMLVQDLTRWHFLALGRAPQALRNDAVFAGVELVLAGCLFATGSLTVVTALVAIGIGALVADLDGARRLDPPAHVEGAVATTQTPGWLLVDFVCTWINLQASVFVVAGLADARQSGLFRAVNDLFGPLSLVQLSLLAVLLPSAAAAFVVGGAPRLRRALLRVSLPAVLLCLAYCVAALLGGRRALVLAYGPAFTVPLQVVLTVALAYLLQTVQMAFIAGLKAAGLARPLALARIWTTPPGLLLLIWLTRWNGLAGAGLALAGGAALRLAVLATLFVRRSGPAAAAEAERTSLPV